MSSENLFFIFSALLIISAIFVVTSTNSILSLLFLILCFIFSSFIIILLECEFIALMLLLIYVGAISILFLFAIMMLEHKRENISNNITEYLPAGVTFGVFLLIIFIFNIINTLFFNYTTKFEVFYTNWLILTDFTIDIETYSIVLYTYYALHLLIVGLILLMVLIGVVYLTKKSLLQKSQQNVPSFKQVSKNFFYFKD